MSQTPNPQWVFKPWIVKRPHGGCQVLFPLSELDRLVKAATKEAWAQGHRVGRRLTVAEGRKQ